MPILLVKAILDQYLFRAIVRGMSWQWVQLSTVDFLWHDRTLVGKIAILSSDFHIPLLRLEIPVPRVSTTATKVKPIRRPWRFEPRALSGGCTATDPSPYLNRSQTLES